MPLFHGVGLGSYQSRMWRTGLWGNVVWRRLRLHPWGRAGVGGLGLRPRRRDRLGRTHLIGERRRDLLALEVWGLSLAWEHMLLGAHGVGLSRGPHLLLQESLLIRLQAGSCLCSQGLGELAHLPHAPLLHLLHVMLHPRLRLRLGRRRRVANSLGLLELVMVGHPGPDSGSRSLLLLLLHYLLPPQDVSELRRHGVVVHVHLLGLGAHPSHGWLELLLRLLLGQASPLDARWHGVHVRHGCVRVYPLLAWHGRRLQPWLALGHARLPREGLRIRVGILGSPLLDERSQQLGVGVKDTKHLLLL